MGMMDRRLGDLTPRDAVNVWAATGILDFFKILFLLLTAPFIARTRRMTREEIVQAQRDNLAQLRRERLYRDLGIG